MKILLDSGHGGEDPGAVADGIMEKEINLEIMLGLANILREQGHQVFCTRDKDTAMSVSNRLKTIKEYKPECFVSLHCNSSNNTQAHGIETIYRDDFDFELAQSIHKSLIANTDLEDRGVKQDIKCLRKRLAVLGDLETPACLIEIGFISNNADRIFVLENIDLIAEAIAEGILEWN